MLCEYGCGKEAKHQFKNGKWCCSKSTSSCPVIKEKISQKLEGRIISEETRRKMSEFQSDKVVSIESRKKMSNSRIGKFKGDNNPNWRGGYFSKGIPLYNNFSDKLVEEIRRNKNDNNILEVRCSYNKCNKWFIPRLGDVYHRIESLNDIKGIGESRLYCSDICKMKCSIFGLNYDPLEKKINTNKIYIEEEIQTLNKFVMQRDNGLCQYCGEKAEHVHHIRPKKLEPFFALDPDFAIAVCKDCHYKYAHKDECSTGNLAKIKCKETTNG